MNYEAMHITLIALLYAIAMTGPVDQSWKQRVPEKDRSRANPVGGRPEAIAAGAQLFADHCAKCHGEDALGQDNKPSLRTPEVQDATDGEIFWLLRNGYLRKGMPSWSSIPEASRWQIVAYLKSLGIAK